MRINIKPGSGRGFTLIELLVVIAIIGVLSSVVLAAVGRARARARDAKRIGDIRQMVTSMEQYHIAHGSYPTGTLSIDSAGNGGAVISDPAALDGGDEPFVPTYTAFMPVAPLPTDGDCQGNIGIGNNNYWYQVTDDGYTYTLTACIGADNADWKAGVRTVTPNGLQ